MIHKSRKLLSHCFPPFMRNLSFRFSEQNKPDDSLRILQGKVYLSDILIKQIINPEFNILDKSLRQHLVDLIDSKTQVPEASRSYMKSMFTTDVFDQPRIQEGMSSGSGDHLFAFCPTHLVTSQMFKALRGKKSNTLFTGHYGISKSVSVMLYSILSNFIAEYKFKTYPKKPQGLGALISNSPKIVYYNIVSSNFMLDRLVSTIRNQCSSQIGEQDLEKIMSYDSDELKERKNLLLFYQKKKIQIIFLIDQFSQIIYLKRDVNFQTDEKIKRQKLNQINRFKQYHKNYLNPEFNLIHLLSSETIQTQQLQGFNLGTHGNHQRINIQQIKYLQRLTKKDVAKEIIDLFLFELGRRFQIPIIQQNESIPLEKIPLSFKKFIPTDSLQVNMNSLLRNYLTEKLISYQNCILTFYTIRRSFQQKYSEYSKIFVKFHQLQNLQSFMNQLVTLLNATIHSSIKQINVKFYDFMKKESQKNYLDNQTKYNLILSLYLSASSYKAIQDNEKQDQYVLDLTPHQQRVNKQILQKYLDNTLFRYENNCVKTFIPPKILTMVLQSQIESTISFPLEHQLLQMKKYFNTDAFSNYCELVFARMLLEIRPQLIFKFIPKKLDEIFQISNAQHLQFIPNSLTQEKSVKSYSIFKHIKPMLLAKITNLKQEQNLNERSSIKRSYFFITNKNFIGTDSNELKDAFALQAIKANNNKKHRAVDNAIITIQIIKDQIKVKITALEISFGDDRIIKKMNKFLEFFLEFKEKNDSSLYIGEQNEQKVEVSLDFFLLTSTNKEKRLKNQLEKENKNFVFENIIYDNCPMIRVKSFSKGENSLLKQIGFVTIGRRLLVKSYRENQLSNSDTAVKMWRLIESIVKGEV